jgi:hypothetical protein
MTYIQRKKDSLIFLGVVLLLTIFATINVVQSTDKGQASVSFLIIPILSQIGFIWVVGKYRIFPSFNPSFDKEHCQEYRVDFTTGRVYQTASYDNYFTFNNIGMVIFFVGSMLLAAMYAICLFPIRLLLNIMELFR